MKSQQTTVTTQETFCAKQIQYTRWQNTKEVELLYLLLTPRKWNRKYKREIIFCIIDQTEMRCRIVKANRKKTVCPYETIKQNTAWSAIGTTKDRNEESKHERRHRLLPVFRVDTRCKTNNDVISAQLSPLLIVQQMTMTLQSVNRNLILRHDKEYKLLQCSVCFNWKTWQWI